MGNSELRNTDTPLGISFLCQTRVQRKHITDMSKTIWDTLRGMSNKIKKKILGYCLVRISFKLYLKKLKNQK